jgi:hypothetical protein
MVDERSLDGWKKDLGISVRGFVHLLQDAKPFKLAGLIEWKRPAPSPAADFGS